MAPLNARISVVFMLALAASVAGCCTDGPQGPTSVVNTVHGNYSWDGETYHMRGDAVEVGIFREKPAAKRRGSVLAGVVKELKNLRKEKPGDDRPPRGGPLDPPTSDDDPGKAIAAGGSLPGWVQLEKSGLPQQVGLPGTVRWTIRWHNAGKHPAENVVICDTIPGPQVIRKIECEKEKCAIEQKALHGGGTLVKIKPKKAVKPGERGVVVIEVHIP